MKVDNSTGCQIYRKRNSFIADHELFGTSLVYSQERLSNIMSIRTDLE